MANKHKVCGIKECVSSAWGGGSFSSFVTNTYNTAILAGSDLYSRRCDFESLIKPMRVKLTRPPCVVDGTVWHNVDMDDVSTWPKPLQKILVTFRKEAYDRRPELRQHAGPYGMHIYAWRCNARCVELLGDRLTPDKPLRVALDDVEAYKTTCQRVILE